MSLRIAGMGWITPLGNGVDHVWRRLLQGDEARPEEIAEQFSDQSYAVFRVPDSALANLAPHPRLRRASAISRFAAAAGLEAIEDAGINLIRKRRNASLLFLQSRMAASFTRSAFTATS